MNKSSVGLAFVKKCLPAHLASYAHLLTFVVNDRLSWMDRDNRENALLLSMAVLDKTWKKWQENPDAYTEAQFCSYVKKSADGMVLKEFADQIRQRKDQLDEFKEELEVRREEEEEIVGLRQASPLSLIATKFTTQSLASLVRFQTQEAQEEWEDNNYTNSYFDDLPLTDEDGNAGYGGGSRSGINPLDMLLFLLPERERLMLRLGDNGKIASVSRDWGISRVRGQQIFQAGMQRLNKAIERLQSGEKYEDLLHECQKAEVTASKKALAGKDAEREQEFESFCKSHSLSRLTIHSRNFFNAYIAWTSEEPAANAEYQAFCMAENYDNQSEEASDEYMDHLYTVHYYQPQFAKK